MRTWVAFAIAAFVGSARAVDPVGSDASRAALAACGAARSAEEPAEATRLFAHAERSAALAVATDETDALAHFALFCTLGERMRRSGVGFGALWDLPRLQAAIDRTLELAPEFPDALAGKGALLLALPRIAGGDAVEGERRLRQALAIDARYLGPRLDLIRALDRRGAYDEARREAQEALAIAEAKGSARAAAEARELLSRVGR